MKLIALIFLALAFTANANAEQIYSVSGAGDTLYSNGSGERHAPASLTKMMTLYILFEELKAGRITLDTPMRVSRNASAQPPSKIGLRQGESILVRDAIPALIVKSANDVAVVVAEHIGHTNPDFVGRMNATAFRMELYGTNFGNPSGLPEPGQATTARDMAVLALKLWQDFPDQFHYFGLREWTWRGQLIETHNRLLAVHPRVSGMKTGYTADSGYNIVISTNEPRTFTVILGSRTSEERTALALRILPEILKEPVLAHNVEGR